MQVACPKCKQMLKFGAVSAQKVAITCPKCGHTFQASVASKAKTAPAQPTTSPFDSLPPAAAPTPTTFRQPNPTAHPRPKRNTGQYAGQKQTPVVAILLGVAAVVLVAGSGAVAWSMRDRIAGGGNAAGEGTQAAESGSSGSASSLLDSIASKVFGSDTPETIQDDFFDLQEQALKQQVSMNRYDEAELEELLDNFLDSSEESRDLLRRGLAIPPSTHEQHEAFKQRYEVFSERSKTEVKQHFDSLDESAKERINKGLLNRDELKSKPYNLMLIRFMQSGFSETLPQEGEQSKIYARELEFLRRLNRFLADLDAEGESSGDASRMEEFADELVALATERSTAEGSGMFVERSLGKAGELHRAMTILYWKQIESLHEPSKDLQDAMAIYKMAQKIFDRAKATTPNKIRNEYAASKQQIKEPVKVAAPTPTPSRVVPAEPSATPQQVSDPDRKTASASGSQSSITQSSGITKRDSMKQNASESEPDTNPPSTNPVPADLASDGSRRGFGGSMRGPERFRSPGSRIRDDSFDSNRFGGPSARGGPSMRSAPRSGPPARNRLELFQGPNGATIVFSKTDNLAGSARNWTKALGVNEYLVRSSFDQAELMIRWSESMEALRKRIDFATVEEVDEEKRQIRIKLK